MRSGLGGQHPPAALAESDTPGAGTFGIAAQDDFVSVLQKAALLAIGQAERLGAAGGELEQAAARVRCRAG